LATIDDVAKKAGVSKSSVSRVLNGNFEYMSEKMKSKILTAIKELNYSPNSLAQSLKNKSTKVIGIILSDISNPFWSEVLKGAQDEANRNKYGLMVSSSNEDTELEKDNILMLKTRQVDGIVVNTTGTNNDLFLSLLEEKFPLVLLDRFSEGMKADSVTVNNVNGAKQAVQSLISIGHERIGILLNPLGNKSPRVERLEGYKLALKENGLPIDEELIKICDSSRGSGVQATEELLSLSNPPTALFTTNEMLNIEVLSGIKRCGLRVPEDVSVFGYDDFPWIPFLDPPLSTVAQPAYEMGVKAVALLIDKLKGETETKVFQLEPEIIIRSSCAPPKNKRAKELMENKQIK
jgi:DNA-binding LacI/PurR family transcriptional regulator